MLAADLRRVTHEGCDFIETFSSHGKMRSECVPVVEKVPLQVLRSVPSAKVSAKVVRVPSKSCRAWKEPMSGYNPWFIILHVIAKSAADGNDAVSLSLRLVGSKYWIEELSTQF